MLFTVTDQFNAATLINLQQSPSSSASSIPQLSPLSFLVIFFSHSQQMPW